MKKEVQKYTAKNLMDSLNIKNYKVFQRKQKLIARIFDIDFTNYQIGENPEDTTTPYRFTKYEFELLKILFKNIEKSPFALTEAKFNSESNREKALLNNNSDLFLSYIQSITEDIDLIDSKYLKAHIYASEKYEETAEWLSAHQKINDSLQTFFTYTNSLNDYDSAKLLRKLSYTIDELLFESLVEQNEINIQQSKYSLNKAFFEIYDVEIENHSYDMDSENHSNDMDSEDQSNDMDSEDQSNDIDSEDQSNDMDSENQSNKDVINFKELYAKRQWYKSYYNGLIPDEYSKHIKSYRHSSNENIKSNLIDVYISNLFKSLYLAPLEKRVDIKFKELYNDNRKATMKSNYEEQRKLREKIRSQEKNKYPMTVNHVYCDIFDGLSGNYTLIHEAIDKYKRKQMDLLDFDSKIKYKDSEIPKLSQNDLFIEFFEEFYNSLLLFSSQITQFQNQFIKDGVQANLLDILYNDLRKIFHLIDPYISEDDHKVINFNHPIFNHAKKSFYELKNNLAEDKVINERIDNITSWNIADKMYRNLNAIK